MVASNSILFVSSFREIELEVKIIGKIKTVLHGETLSLLVNCNPQRR